VVLKSINYDLHGSTGQVSGQDKRTASLVKICVLPRTRKEMQAFVGIASREHFSKTFLTHLLDTGQLKITIPDKPNSRYQKYVRVNAAEKG